MPPDGTMLPDGTLLDRPAGESVEPNPNTDEETTWTNRTVQRHEESGRRGCAARRDDSELLEKLERLEHRLRAERARHRAIVQRYERLLGERGESRTEDRTRSPVRREERRLTSRVIRWLQRL